MKGDPAATERPANSIDASIGIVVSDWHKEITHVLLESAIATLEQCGVERDDIYVAHVPGTMELPFAARQMSQIQEPSAVIVLDCITKEDNPLFEAMQLGVTNGITSLNVRSEIPYIFGVMVANNLEEARQRLARSEANAGTQSAISSLKMVNMMVSLVNF